MKLILTRKVFGEKIGWIHFASDLSHRDRFGPHLFLYPQSVGLKVSELAKARPRGDPEGCTGVSPNAHWNVQTYIFQQGLMS